MHYELWGTELANLLAEFDTEEEGLAFVRSLLDEGWSGDQLSLGPPPSRDGSEVPVLTGAELVDRARAAAPNTETVPT
jgi:hypothetical protein